MRLIDADRLRNIAISNRDIEMVYEIDHSPTVERPHGEWIIQRNKQGAHIYSVCSKCNVPYLDTDFPNFCPNCGSDNRPRILDASVDGAGKDGNVKEGDEK